MFERFLGFIELSCLRISSEFLNLRDGAFVGIVPEKFKLRSRCEIVAPRANRYGWKVEVCKSKQSPRYFHPTAAIFRLRKAICVASGRFFGQTSWQASSDMQPNTPLSSPINS